MITIQTLDGDPRQVETLDCDVAGLAIHHAVDTEGLMLTHVPSGMAAGWWPEGTPEQVAECARALAVLGDWTRGKAAVATRAAAYVIMGYGGYAGTGAGRWFALEHGELTEIIFAGES